MKPCRPLRADAARNRARVLEVAYEVFAEEGLAAPIDEVARRAGVGAGTVYRHFPTKTALFEGIIRHRLDQIVEQAESLADAEDGAAAFFRFFTLMVDQGAADKGLTDALAGEGIDIEAVVPGVEARFIAALSELLAGAQRSGEVRMDIDVVDVKAMLVACQIMHRHRGDETASRHLVDVVMDGMRNRS